MSFNATAWLMRLVTRLKARINPLRPLDAELAEIIEAVWAAEVMWRLEDRVEASIRYGEQGK